MVKMVEKGQFVQVGYIGRVKDGGQIFDLTDEEVAKKEGIFNEKLAYGPIVVVVGAGHLMPALDRALEGMMAGETKKIEVPLADAFGERDQKKVQTLPEKAFEEQKMEPKPGMVINIRGIYGKVQSVGGGRVMVDFNHPLAGKDLEYELTLARIVEDQTEKAAGLVDLFFRGKEKFGVSLEGDALRVTIPGEVFVEPELMEKVAAEAKTYLKTKKALFTFEFE